MTFFSSPQLRLLAMCFLLLGLGAACSGNGVTTATEPAASPEPEGPTPAAFEVTGVTVAVAPASHSGACPKKFEFSATIAASGDGEVIYRWERSDGASAPIQSLTFGAAGSETVSSTWTLSAVGGHWKRVRILSPNEVVSHEAAFTLACF